MKERGIISEQEIIPIGWSEREKEILKNDGALIYRPNGLTIRGQRIAGRRIYYHVRNPRLLDCPSRQIEVAIYPAPDRFFVPGCFERRVRDQRQLLRDDAESLRRRLSINNLDEIIPEAADFVEVFHQHLDITGKRLLGVNYDFASVRTDTPVLSKPNEHRFAVIQDETKVNCLYIYGSGWWRNNVGVARWLVPRWYLKIA